MNLIKTFLGLSTIFILTACETLPTSVQNFGHSVNEGIKKLDTMGQTGTTTTTSKVATKSGMLTNSQCQNSQGKTKSQIESQANEKLTDQRAAALTSFAVTYNFEISDRQNRYGASSQSRAFCSLTFEGNNPSSKVLHWSVIG